MGEIWGGIKVMGRRGRRRKQLRHDLKETWGYRKLKEEALDRTVRGNSLWKRPHKHTAEWMNRNIGEENPPSSVISCPLSSHDFHTQSFYLSIILDIAGESKNSQFCCIRRTLNCFFFFPENAETAIPTETQALLTGVYCRHSSSYSLV